MIANERQEAHLVRRLVPERSVAQQSLRAQGFEAIAASRAIHLIDEPVQRLGVGVRVGMLEVVQDQASPARVPHEAEKAKQINAVQTPTPNAERLSGRVTMESNHAFRHA